MKHNFLAIGIAVVILGGVMWAYYSGPLIRTTHQPVSSKISNPSGSQEESFQLGVPTILEQGKILSRGKDSISLNRTATYMEKYKDPNTVEAHFMTETAINSTTYPDEIILLEGGTHKYEKGVAVFPYNVTLVRIIDGTHAIVQIDSPTNQ